MMKKLLFQPDGELASPPGGSNSMPFNVLQSPACLLFISNEEQYVEKYGDNQKNCEQNQVCVNHPARHRAGNGFLRVLLDYRDNAHERICISLVLHLFVIQLWVANKKISVRNPVKQAKAVMNIHLTIRVSMFRLRGGVSLLVSFMAEEA
ncbi:MAG: hypothetical protein LIO63_07890 [Akkermansia sp.]|nr:hypothetical protein [Akkermansia sp.]